MDFRQHLLSYQKLAAHVRELETRFESSRQARLASLPAEFGYADLASFVQALRAAARGTPESRPRTGARRARRDRVVPAAQPPAAAPAPSPAPAGIAAPATSPVASTQATPAAAPTAPVIPARPTGTSLDDPANFGLMPDRSVLQAGSLPLPLHRERMGEALRFATRVLHTSKVPAAVWREWRQFERQLGEALRATLPAADPDAV